ncbi:MAG: GDSL-type esterase/lipase family protein [Promethearchaeota archaeon]
MIFLCLGNSLTAGYPGYDPVPDDISHGYGDYNSQYEFWLKKFCIEYLEAKGSNNVEVIKNNLLFINKGVPGELTSNFLRRINYDLLSFKPKPNCSIIIGGTNDLGWGIPNQKVFENIKKLHEISREFSIFSIGGTIPPIRMEQSSSSYNKRKITLNTKLRNYFNDNEIPYADLYNGMMDDEGNLTEEYAYIDGLHFTVEGYRKMGSILFNEVIKNIIEKEYL